ncbi:MAG TPA: hypothetical protein VLA66_11830 [Thermoanaerobaculia bacterium]|nr:hypothetical protein [Thermoanaerobaculia bacterium]
MEHRPSAELRAVAAGALLAAALLGAPSPSGAADVPELSVEAGTASYDSDTGDSSDSSWGVVGIDWGDRFRLRAELPWIRLEGGASPPGAGLGPISPPPSGRRQRQGQASNPGQGPAAGPGAGAAASTLDPTLAAASDPAPTSSVSGLGDVRIGAFYRLAGGGVRLYRLDLGATAKLPTADEEEGLGTGELDWRLGLSGEYRFWSLTLFGGAGYNRLGDPPGVVLEDVVDGFVGVESQPLAERFLLSGWLEGNPEVIDGAGETVALGVGLRTLGEVRFELQGTIGLSDAAEDFRISAGISFGLRPPVAGTSGVRR